MNRRSQLYRSIPGPVGLLFVALGLSPITTLAFSLIEIVPLYYGALFGVLPLLLFAVPVGLRWPEVGRIASRGLLIGLLAVFLYDCTRLPLIYFGNWTDFIPTIATHLIPGADPSWAVGYAWRYLGNGGGMGLAFVVGYRMIQPSWNVWILGPAYGVAIWTCLLITLSLIPGEPLFMLTPTTFTMSLVGHIVYGGGLAFGLRGTPIL